VFHPGGDARDEAGRVQHGFLPGLLMRPMAVAVPGHTRWRLVRVPLTEDRARSGHPRRSAGSGRPARPAQAACGVWFYRAPGYV
jgi:hypothetical protein